MALLDIDETPNDQVNNKNELKEDLALESKSVPTNAPTDSTQTDGASNRDENNYSIEDDVASVTIDDIPKKKIGRKTILGFVIGGVILLIAIVVLLVSFLFVIPSNNYAEGQAAFEKGDYVLAAEKYEKAGDYGDSKQRLEEIVLLLVEGNQFDIALDAARKLPIEITDSYVLYVQGAKDVSEGNIAEALEEFKQSEDLAVSREMFVNTSSTMAMALCKKEEYETARSLMTAAADIDKETEESVRRCTFITAYIYLAEGNSEKASQLLSSLPKDYSFEDVSTFELLGTLAIAGKWSLVKMYFPDDGTFSTKKLMELGYPQDSLLFLPNGKYLSTAIAGAYGSNGGTWCIDSAYNGPDEYGLIFDKDSPAESRGSLNGNTLTMYYATSDNIGTYRKAK